LQDDEVQNQHKRTVLFVINAYSYGGSEKHVLELLKRLEDPKVQSIVLTIDSDPFTERLAKGNRSNITVRSNKSLKSFGDWFRIFREIKPDVVVLVYGTLWMLPWIAAPAARRAGIHKLYAVHHLMPQPPSEPRILEIKSPRDVLRRVFGRRVRRMLSARVPPRLCKKTICVSNAVRDALIQQYGFPARKMLTVHNGISLQEFVPDQSGGAVIRTRLGIRPDEFVLVCAARLSPEKRIDILLSAMSQIIQKDRSLKCIIIGEGDLEETLLEQVKLLGLSSHVFFEGFQADVRPYLSAADAFVLTSRIEGLPFSVLEAMACGLPCVVTNVGGNAEAVAHNVNGFVVSPGSPDEVAQAILYLRTHPEERARMARNSRTRVENGFDIETRMADIARLILS
jgi:glycosyltransferase involved in cell wall biosynthesis